MTKCLLWLCCWFCRTVPVPWVCWQPGSCWRNPGCYLWWVLGAWVALEPEPGWACPRPHRAVRAPGILLGGGQKHGRAPRRGMLEGQLGAVCALSPALPPPARAAAWITAVNPFHRECTFCEYFCQLALSRAAPCKPSLSPEGSEQGMCSKPQCCLILSEATCLWGMF